MKINQWWERKGLMYNEDKLTVGGIDCEELAKKYSTPLYVYDGNRIVENFNKIKNSLEKFSDRDVWVSYAIKANSNPAILKLLHENGCRYCDASSPFEGRIAIDAGFDPYDIMYTGTSVSEEALKYALQLGLFINIDSISEMKKFAKLSDEFNNKREAAIRWNPNRGAGWHPDVITAGKEVHGRPIKFGIEERKVLHVCDLAKEYDINIVGLHQHIGSGWLGTDVEEFLKTVHSTLYMAEKMIKHGCPIRFVGFGGGPGIPYKGEQREFPIYHYAEGICSKVKNSGLQFEAIEVEPGRYIVGDAGILLTEVNTVEEKNGNLIIGVDAGFNTLIRPAFYGAYHEIVPCKRTRRFREASVVGPLCETGDILTETIENGFDQISNRRYKRLMEIPKEGDFLAILCAGAYGFSMASNYNSWPKPAEVLIVDGNDHLIRERESYEDLIRNVRV